MLMNIINNRNFSSIESTVIVDMPMEWRNILVYKLVLVMILIKILLITL